MSNNDTSRYTTCADFWRDTADKYGTEEASGICGRYLETQLKMELPDDEKQFCRELFAAMYEDTAGMTDPAKLVYPYDFQNAIDCTETSYYHGSRKRNTECARAIDGAIHVSCCKPNYYNLELAAMSVVHAYGFARVMAVLAYQLQRSDWDGRYSRANKDWAKGCSLPKPAFSGAVLNAHPTLIEDFTSYVRKLYGELGAERFALPGRVERGERVAGYEIIRAISFDDQCGFAIGLNPDAFETLVTWQFTVEDGKRDFYWGHYSGELSRAAEDYIARVIVYMSRREVKEVQRTPAAEIHEPTEAERGASEEKPSVLKQIRNAQNAPRPPRDNKAPDRDKGDAEI